MDRRVCILSYSLPGDAKIESLSTKAQFAVLGSVGAPGNEVSGAEYLKDLALLLHTTCIDISIDIRL